MLTGNRFFMIRGEDGHEYGPVELAELREWVQENRAGIGSDVRLDEPGAPWHPWQTYPELIALLAENNAVAPVPGVPSLAIAPVWRRAVAYFMDAAILSTLLSPVLSSLFQPQQLLEIMSNPNALQTMPQPMFRLFFAFVIIENACLILYFALCNSIYGRTPAKALLRIKVVDPAGQKPTWIKSFVRAVALVISVSFAFPLAYVFLNPHRRALHDVVADTCVVRA